MIPVFPVIAVNTVIPVFPVKAVNTVNPVFPVNAVIPVFPVKVYSDPSVPSEAVQVESVIPVRAGNVVN